MRFFRSKSAVAVMALGLSLGFTLDTLQKPAYSQETTGGLQGEVKDASGAVVPRAKVVITSPAQIGSKEVVTDATGYYRFANLAPGTYTMTVSAQGFSTYKREGLVIEVGHLPSVEVALQVGAEAQTVEVSSAAPVIDTTSTENMTNISKEQLQNLPTGTSFQSVIQFAPMARNEPLSGAQTRGVGTGGTGGSMPGSSGNGQGFGYMIGGAADSESSYLVEGQDTENISGGYSKANVPMDFIQEVQMKTSGISAEYGGALGGVVNVIMKKGSNDFHGSFFTTYESSGTDGNPVNAYLRQNPLDAGTTFADGSPLADPGFQLYQAQKDHFRTVQPGFTIGGPILKDRIWFFAGFQPTVNTRARTVNFGPSADPTNANSGNQYFTNDRQTYYTTGRIDAALGQKVRVFASWLYQYARATGVNLPTGDPIAPETGYLNPSINTPLSAFSHGLGWAAPNETFNFGGDLTLTQKLIATTRFGYFFDNYHDFGWPTSTPNLVWDTNGVLPDGSGVLDNSGAAVPTSLAQSAGTTTTPYNSTYTLFNADKHYRFNQDLAYVKGGWWGTHNFKFGYQLNHLVNVIDQNGNVPEAFLHPGQGHNYSPLTQTGGDNCAILQAEWGPCAGQYGYMTVQDFSTILTAPASDYNHALYAQDSWQVGKGLTLDLGIRIEKENLPAPGGVKVSSISFPWSDKVEPRLGAAWDPTRRGKMKIFGSYGVVNDVMKLLLAQTSWGAQAYEQCTYAFGPDGTAAGFNASDIDLVFKQGRACPNGPADTQANFASGAIPASLSDPSGVSLIENINLRPWEPVAPGVKPYKQHEYVAGWDYEISPGWAFEARYDRRRLDHVIEDASLSDIAWGETYAIVNPGEGVNKTLDGYANYLTSLGQAFGVPGWAFNDTTDYGPGVAFGTCPSCPANPKAVRNYDGLELRVTMNPKHGFSGMASWTYSRLWGNYTGLTTTDQSDGGSTGRNSPDTTRAFDEPFYYFGENGKSNNGLLPTDRPNVLKGYVYYTKTWWKRQSTTIGLFQTGYEGTPLASFIDMTTMFGPSVSEAVYPWGRDKWVDMTADPTTGAITLGAPRTNRLPWYTQSDLNLSHTIKTGDHQTLTFEATALNALNQRAVVSKYQGMNSTYWTTPLYPGVDSTGAPINLASGAALYQLLEGGYNVQQWINGNGGQVPYVVKNSEYNQPFLYQNARSLRLGARFTF
jgi:hypothetical protein